MKYEIVRHTLTKEELRRRRHTLGSSEIAAVVGCNPYQSVHAVWSSKCLGKGFEGNEATELGNILEPAILAIYSDRYDIELLKGEYTVGPEPWVSCTPDAHRVNSEGLVEAKLVGLRSMWMWGQGNTDDKESDAVPIHYMCQAQWQMIVTREPFVDIAALLGTEFRTYRLWSNEEIQSRLLDRGRRFWARHVLTRIPPPVDGSDGARDMLKELYPRSGADPLQADDALNALAASLAEARQLFTKAQSEKQLRENQIKAELKEARGAIGNGWRIRYATTKTGTRPFVFEEERA